MPNYLDLLGDYYQTTEAYVLSDGNPETYDDIVWISTPVAKATLDTLVMKSKSVTEIEQLAGLDNMMSEQMSFSPDTTRSKDLSAESFTFVYSENKISNMDWLKVGAATDAASGFIMPFDGTIVRATGHCEDTNNKTYDFDLYINTTNVGSVLTITGANEQSACATNLNYDFDAGDKLRLRANLITGAGWLEDTVIVIWIKWRKA